MYKKDNLIFFVLLSILVIGTVSIFNPFSKQKDFSFEVPAPVLTNKKQFIFSDQQTRIESPELCLVQKSFLLSSTPPIRIKPRILGDIIGTVVQDLGQRRDIVEYVVEEGDNLWLLSEKFGVSLNTLLWANDLSRSSVLKVGQKLVIPPVSGVIHLVKSGDTISGIAKMYKADPEKIVVFNELSSPDDIFIGDILMVPDGIKPTVIAPTKQVALASSYFISPTTGRISQGLHWYNAIDISNKCGTPIYAAAAGTVQRAGYIRIGGLRITILHSNGIPTYYGHLSKILVVPGQRVSQGQLIGYMGNTGYTKGLTGCHLHFDVLAPVKNPLAKYPVGSYIRY